MQGSLRVTDAIYGNKASVTNGITTYTNDDISAFNALGILFSNTSNTILGRISMSTGSNMGIYAGGTIFIRPNSAASASTADGVKIDGAGLAPTVNNTENLGASDLKWANVYSTTFTGNLTGTASNITTTEASTTSVYPVGVTSTATTTLRRQLNHTIHQYNYVITEPGGQSPSFRIIGSKYSFGLLIGSGNDNRGIYQWAQGSSSAKWLLYWGASNAHFNTGVNIDDSTASTDVATGALVVNGGVGIAKKLYVGEALTLSGTTVSTAMLGFSRTGEATPNYINVPASSALAVSVGGASGSNIRLGI